jgi:hypothetical protein
MWIFEISRLLSQQIEISVESLPKPHRTLLRFFQAHVGANLVPVAEMLVLSSASIVRASPRFHHGIAVIVKMCRDRSPVSDRISVSSFFRGTVIPVGEVGSEVYM